MSAMRGRPSINTRIVLDFVVVFLMLVIAAYLTILQPAEGRGERTFLGILYVGLFLRLYFPLLRIEERLGIRATSSREESEDRQS
jgi:hypothetical protein